MHGLLDRPAQLTNLSISATISLVDTDTFWVDAYFEETNLTPIQVRNPARFKPR